MSLDDWLCKVTRWVKLRLPLVGCMVLLWLVFIVLAVDTFISRLLLFVVGWGGGRLVSYLDKRFDN